MSQKYIDNLILSEYSPDVATTIREIISKKNKSKKYIKLKDYIWGFGIEHESRLFHLPSLDKFDGTMCAFNVIPFVVDLIKNRKLLRDDERALLEDTPLEPSGRRCNFHEVLKKVPFGMPEFITDKPFSSLKTGRRTIEWYNFRLNNIELKYINLLRKLKSVRELEDKYGLLDQYPFGMTNYITYDSRYKGKENDLMKKYKKYKFHPLIEDYTGSYHITITLPFKENTKDKEFIEMHQNFANQIQWLEPLLMTGFFSSDQKAMGTDEERVKGSFRVMMTGWGNFAGSDIRKFNKGIGRYANIKSYWRDNLQFKNIKNIKHCLKLSKATRLREGKSGQTAVAGYSSNMRTFGSEDPLRPWHRESGIGMSKPNGIEIRMFDSFDTKYMLELSRLMIYIAENSKRFKTKNYVYKDKDWIKAMKGIMKNGWSYKIDIKFLNKLRKNLNLKIKTKSLIAFDIFNKINDELYLKNKKGDYPFMMLDKIIKPKIKNLNRKSYEFGLMIKLIRDETLLYKFNKIINTFDKKTIIEFKKHLFKILDKKLWKNDVDGILYFFETLKIATLTITKSEIKTIKLKKKVIKVYQLKNRMDKNWGTLV